MHEPTDPRTMTSAARLREHAAEVLRRLLDEREQSRRRQQETGKQDPMTVITGRSAVESAIVRTRAMIGEMDVLLAQMNRDLEELEHSRHGVPVGAAAIA